MSKEAIMDRTTDVVAVGALVSPAWLPWLQGATEVAGYLIPILGAVWLVTQIIHKIIHWNNV